MAVVTPATPQQTPARIGPWLLLRELGGHPSQWLYMAQHCSVERLALLKVLPPEAARDRATRAQFQLEARIAAASPGPLLQAYDVFDWGACLVAVMEWPQGEVASKLRLPVDGARAAAICLDVAHALTTMHRSGVVNGAVRSNAVLVGSDAEIWRPQAKLLDLGFCFRMGQVVHGTAVDAKSDVYGLGTLCFELLTGRAWHAHPGASLPARTPERLVNLLQRCLAAEPAHRPADMHQVADELEWIRYELVWGRFSPPPIPDAPQSDADFGEHAGWFIEEGAELTDEQLASLVGYAEPRSGLRHALSFLAVTLLAGTLVFGGVVLGLSAYGG